MRVETTGVTAQAINRNFLKKIDEGRVKEAESEGSAFIRTKLRQTAFSREILPPIVLADDEIDRDVNTDLPRKIVEKEPDSVATFVNFKGTGDRTWFSGPRYAVYFGKIESQRFTKNKFELMTYQNDIRKILTDNSVKDMADIEDGKFYETIVAAVNGVGGQDLTTTDTELKNTGIVPALKAHIARKIPIGKILMTKSLYLDLLNLPATQIGDDVGSRHYDDGVEGEEKLFGYPVITTIKNDILSDKEFFIFGPENYLGNFFLLQDATLFIKQEADMISFWSYSAPGIGIGNTNAITRMTIS
jgi:hypothetical protein